MVDIIDKICGWGVHPRKSDHMRRPQTRVHIHHLWEEARTKKIKARTFRTAFWEEPSNKYGKMRCEKPWDAPSGVPRFPGPSWLPLVRG